MTTSGTVTQDFGVDELVTLALHTEGSLNAAHDAAPEELRLGRRLLWLGLQALKSDGIIMRASDRYAQALTSGVNYVTPPAGTLSIEQGATCQSSDGVTDRPINLYTQEEYQRIPDKTVSGPPAFYYPEKQSDGSWKILLYPVPDSTWTSITYVRTRRLQDITNGLQTIDLDPAWYLACVYFLASHFARSHGRLEVCEELNGKYQAELGRAQSDETPHGDGMLVLPSTPWDSW